LKTGGTGSRTPLQILADYHQTGDNRDRTRWRRYSHVTRNLAAVRWSRGLRAVMVGQAEESERTDAELAAEDISGALILAIEGSFWSCIRLAGLDHAVLVAAQCGGLDAVSVLISQTASLPPRRLPEEACAFTAIVDG